MAERLKSLDSNASWRPCFGSGWTGCTHVRNGRQLRGIGRSAPGEEWGAYLVLVPHELHAVRHVAQQHKVFHDVEAGQQGGPIVEGCGSRGAGRWNSRDAHMVQLPSCLPRHSDTPERCSFQAVVALTVPSSAVLVVVVLQHTKELRSAVRLGNQYACTAGKQQQQQPPPPPPQQGRQAICRGLGPPTCLERAQVSMRLPLASSR